jgi:hypothetical protein
MSTNTADISMPVFNGAYQNDVDDMKKACDDYSKVLDKTIEAKRDYRRAIEEIEKKRRTRVREEMEKDSNIKPLDDYKRDDNEMRNLALGVFKKECLVSG